jgi:hypothetical protein
MCTGTVFKNKHSGACIIESPSPPPGVNEEENEENIKR